MPLVQGTVQAAEGARHDTSGCFANAPNITVCTFYSEEMTTLLADQTTALSVEPETSNRCEGRAAASRPSPCHVQKQRMIDYCICWQSTSLGLSGDPELCGRCRPRPEITELYPSADTLVQTEPVGRWGRNNTQ